MQTVSSFHPHSPYIHSKISLSAILLTVTTLMAYYFISTDVKTSKRGNREHEAAV